MKAKNEKGNIYGLLAVIKRQGSNGRGRANWLCKCKCGKERLITGDNLRQGHYKSCGCIKGSNMPSRRVHGMARTSFYRRWQNMKDRCLNIKSTSYQNYGGRGIKVCERWLSFKKFKIDMFKSFSSELSLDRIDNDGNYSKENCRWATKEIQTINRRTTVYLTYKGVKKPISEWAKEKNINLITLHSRKKAGYSDTEIIEKLVPRGVSI